MRVRDGVCIDGGSARPDGWSLTARIARENIAEEGIVAVDE